MTDKSNPLAPADIRIRAFEFDFPETIDPVWVPNNRYRSHFYNGVSLTMPYLEPFLVKTMREAGEQIEETWLSEDIRGFNGQEAQHYRCHRRLNEVLKRSGHPQFAQVEQRIERAYQRLQRRSLRTRLAYSAGFECMTNGFTNWMLAKRVDLFRHAQPHITSFWLMHVVEETEHKTVAFDVYQHLYGDYGWRVLGVLHGSFHVVGLGLLGMFSALKCDGWLYRWGSIVGITKQLADLTRHVGPYLLRALGPNYDPRDESDPGWFDEWVNGYAAQSPQGYLPLVDTDDQNMPVPFASAR